jgi:hypothetical protein
MAVVAVAASPLAALSAADAAVDTGTATANGPGIAIENTGGNVENGKGHSESRVVFGDPSQIPPLATPKALSTPTRKVDPAANARARAKALVDAARARAQAQIDAARRQAEEAVERAHEQADEARAHSGQSSASASSYSTDD